MTDLPKLNFPAIQLKARKQNGQIEVWDNLRKTYLVLTPEEWVRRHLIVYLEQGCGVQALRIVQEYPVQLNQQAQRADVVVVDDHGKPLLLVECKAPTVAISQQTLGQAVRYNSVLKARYVALTNGMKHYCYEFSEGRYIPMKHFPKF